MFQIICLLLVAINGQTLMPPASISFVNNILIVGRSSTSFNAIVQRVGNNNGTVSALVQTKEGTSNGAFIPLSQTLEWIGTDMDPKSVTIQLARSVVSPSTFYLMLTAPVGFAVIGEPSTLTVSVGNQDQSTVVTPPSSSSINSGSSSLPVSSSAATVLSHRSNSSSTALTIGLVVGLVVGLPACCLLLLLITKRRDKKSQSNIILASSAPTASTQQEEEKVSASVKLAASSPGCDPEPHQLEQCDVKAICIPSELAAASPPTNEPQVANEADCMIRISPLMRRTRQTPIARSPGLENLSNHLAAQSDQQHPFAAAS